MSTNSCHLLKIIFIKIDMSVNIKTEIFKQSIKIEDLISVFTVSHE